MQWLIFPPVLDSFWLIFKAYSEYLRDLHKSEIQVIFLLIDGQNPR